MPFLFPFTHVQHWWPTFSYQFSSIFSNLLLGIQNPSHTKLLSLDMPDTWYTSLLHIVKHKTCRLDSLEKLIIVKKESANTLILNLITCSMKRLSIFSRINSSSQFIEILMHVSRSPWKVGLWKVSTLNNWFPRTLVSVSHPPLLLLLHQSQSHWNVSIFCNWINAFYIFTIIYLIAITLISLFKAIQIILHIHDIWILSMLVE